MILNDSKMCYDALNHRYVLKNEHVLEGMNIDLRAIIDTSSSADEGQEIDRVLDRVSRIVYSYVYNVAALKNETERTIALDADARNFILSAMEEQLIYMLQNGDLSVLSGVNASTGSIMDRKQLKTSQIAPLAEDAILNSGYVSPIVPRLKKDIEPRYLEEGY